MKEARKLIEDLVDPDDCRYDHNDLCQTHGCDERPCAHERAKEFLVRPLSNADHCTSEERAVIEAINKFYETPERPKPRFISRDCDSGHCTDRERDLLDALLAARAAREKRQ